MNELASGYVREMNGQQEKMGSYCSLLSQANTSTGKKPNLEESLKRRKGKKQRKSTQRPSRSAHSVSLSNTDKKAKRKEKKKITGRSHH